MCLRTSALCFHSLGSYLVNLGFASRPFSPGRHNPERVPLKRRVQECVVPGLWSTCPSPPASMRRTGPSVQTMTGWATSSGGKSGAHQEGAHGPQLDRFNGCHAASMWLGFRSEGGQVMLHIGAAWRDLLWERKKEWKKEKNEEKERGRREVCRGAQSEEKVSLEKKDEIKEGYS